MAPCHAGSKPLPHARRQSNAPHGAARRLPLAAATCAPQLADGTAIERTNQQAASLAAASCQHLRGTLMAITRYSHSSAHQSPSTRSRCARATPQAAAAVAPALAGIQALFELLVVAAYPSAAAAAARRRQSQSTHSRCSRRRCLHSSAAIRADRRTAAGKKRACGVVVVSIYRPSTRRLAVPRPE